MGVFFRLIPGLEDVFSPWKRIQIPESGTYLLMECLESLKIVESVTLRFEGRDTAEGIENPAKDWNPESEFH